MNKVTLRTHNHPTIILRTILSHLSAENCKIFILDPEDEYGPLTRNLGGKMIDVGTNKSGILNPFHIMASLEDLDSDSEDMDDMDSEDIDELVNKGKNKTFFT